MGKIKSFLSATRPRTLPASFSPVLLGSAAAFSDGKFRLIPSILCLGVALFAQIASNFANDYFDFKNGSDTALRQGPERMSASGGLKPETVLYGSIGFIISACLCGLGLLFFAPWWIIPVGIAIALCVFAYSAGPYPLSRHALGDLAVFLFYGIIPVTLTYFVQTGTFSPQVLWLGSAVGLLSVNILIVNNYRDLEEDRECGKITTVVLFGRRHAATSYLINHIAAFVILQVACPTAPARITALAFLLWGARLWNILRHTTGRPLNKLLGTTALTVFIWSLAASAVILLS